MVSTWKGILRSGIGGMTRRRAFTRVVRPLTLRGSITRRVWVHLPPPRSDFDVPVGSSSFRYRYRRGDSLARALYWAGLDGDEGETFAVFLEAVRGSGLVLDVGANTGIFTLAACAADPHVEVVCVEAAAKIADMLEDHVALNGFGKRVEVQRVAAGAEDGTAEFLVPTSDVPTSSRLASAPHRETTVDSVEVPMRTLDSLAGDRTVGVIKIDVEGSECEVLRGARGVLVRDHPAVIFELLPEASPGDIRSAFEGTGYRFLALTAKGPVPVDHLAADPTRRERNILAVHSADQRWATR